MDEQVGSSQEDIEEVRRKLQDLEDSELLKF